MLISLICTTYNRAQYLPDMLASFAALRTAPYDLELELIVYDDGSTDATSTLFDGRDERVRYIRSEANLGPSAGRNAAAKGARGDYLFMIDSDDVLMQRSMAHFAGELEREPADMVIAEFVRGDGALRYRIGQDYYGWMFEGRVATLRAIMAGQHFVQHSFVIRRTLFTELGGYDEGLAIAEDLDLYIRVLLHDARVRYVPFVSHLHRLHGGNLSMGIDLERHQLDVAALRRRYDRRLRDLGI